MLRAGFSALLAAVFSASFRSVRVTPCRAARRFLMPLEVGVRDHSPRPGPEVPALMLKDPLAEQRPWLHPCVFPAAQQYLCGTARLAHHAGTSSALGLGLLVPDGGREPGQTGFSTRLSAAAVNLSSGPCGLVPASVRAGAAVRLLGLRGGLDPGGALQLVLLILLCCLKHIWTRNRSIKARLDLAFCVKHQNTVSV